MPAHDRPMLLGEWACLGVLVESPGHGYSVAQRVGPTGDVGRIWSLSRGLTYRAIEQLVAWGYVRELRDQPGITRVKTPLTATARGTRELMQWLATPVEHLRDVRTELLVKLQVCHNLDVPISGLIAAQRAHFEPLVAALAALAAQDVGGDPVLVWRHENSLATMRFLDRLG